MTKQAVTETIRFARIEIDDEQIMKSFIKSERHDTEKAMAEQLIRKGKMTLEEIADCVSSLSFDE